MAYEVTATRRRPQAFDALAGQEFVAETLKNTIQSKKIAHAYLFSGPRGCGKTSTARIFAKALNCENGPTATPCGKCQHCIEITQGSALDVIEIDGASNTSVNDVRQIKEEVMYAPQSSRYKIYIIDEVHMLSTSAFNALLKTIEEPPEYVVFIFATTELQKVPATIKSRCQQFNFRLVPIDTVEKLLADAASEIGIQADEEALYWVARESTGSVRDAYTLFDQVAAFSGDHITYEKIRDKLGLVGVDRLNVIFDDCVSGRANEAILKLDEFLQSGISIEQFISNSTDYLRSLLLIKNGIKKESLLGQSADRFSVNVLNSWNPVQIERAISIFFQLYRDIRYSLSPRYELELAISRLCWLSEYVSPMEVKRAIDQARNLLLSTPTSVPIPNQNQQFIDPKQRSQGQFSNLMNPTAWKQNANSASPSIQPQPLKPKKPLVVLDALKTLPEYQNAQSVSSSIREREEKEGIPQQNEAQTENGQNVQQPNSEILRQAQNDIMPTQPVQNFSQQVPNFQQMQTMQPTQPVQPVQQMQPVQQIQPVQPVQPVQPMQQMQQMQNSLGAEQPSSSDDLEVPLTASAAVEIDSVSEFSRIKEEELQQFVTGELSVKNGVLAASLMGTRNWKKLADKITFEVTNDFQKFEFDRNRAQILSEFEKIFGRRIDFDAILKKVEYVDPRKNAPESVKLLLSTFRGEIVGVAPKSQLQQQPVAQSVPAEQKSAENEDEDDGSENQIDIVEEDDDE
ncbi:MAG: DNA polymerase III subunit gamma/tau [Treponema sp.]|nr:DNA polymerase III subunit gamma/tau [Treponema sp.]